jgi:hypothetical protein
MERLSGYENTEHVLRILIEFHCRMSTLYSELAATATEQRSQMTLHYLQEHEEQHAEALRRSCADAPRSLLANWFQIPFPEDPETFFQSIDPENALDSDAIVALAGRVDGYLMRLLIYIESRAETANVKELFASLQALQNNKQRLRSRALASFLQT